MMSFASKGEISLYLSPSIHGKSLLQLKARLSLWCCCLLTGANLGGRALLLRTRLYSKGFGRGGACVHPRVGQPLEQRLGRGQPADERGLEVH